LRRVPVAVDAHKGALAPLVRGVPADLAELVHHCGPTWLTSLTVELADSAEPANECAKQPGYWHLGRKRKRQ